MINKLIAMFAGSKIAGAFKAVQGFLQHKKTYALGTLTCFQGIVGLWSDIAGLDGIPALITFVQSLKGNSDWQMILAGLAMFAIKSAIAKTAPKSEFDSLGLSTPGPGGAGQ